MTEIQERSKVCDSCGKRLRDNHHELIVSDHPSGQLIGRYHAVWGECVAQATKYFVAGAVVQATFVHPDRCGDEQEHCDAGLAEVVA